MTKLNEDGTVTGLTVKRAWSTKNEDGDKGKMNATIDFEGITVGQLAELASKDLVIRRQAVERKLSKEEIEANDGQVIHWSQMGLKVKSHAEKLAGLVALGIPTQVAELMLSDPEKAKELMESMS